MEREAVIITSITLGITTIILQLILLGPPYCLRTTKTFLMKATISSTIDGRTTSSSRVINKIVITTTNRTITILGKVAIPCKQGITGVKGNVLNSSSKITEMGLKIILP